MSVNQLVIATLHTRYYFGDANHITENGLKRLVWGQLFVFIHPTMILETAELKQFLRGAALASVGYLAFHFGEVSGSRPLHHCRISRL